MVDQSLATDKCTMGLHPLRDSKGCDRIALDHPVATVFSTHWSKNLLSLLSKYTTSLAYLKMFPYFILATWVPLFYRVIVDTVFWHVLKKVMMWRKSCRFERNQNMHMTRICRLSRSWRAGGIFPEDADQPVLVISRWRPCRWIREKERVWFDQDSDNSVVII